MTEGLFLFCLDLDLIKGIVTFCCLCKKVFSFVSKVNLTSYTQNVF